LIQSETRNAVTTITILRPEVRNAIDRETADALAAAFLAYEKDEGAKVAVLCGEGGNFCAGADLKALASGESINRMEEPSGDPLDISAPLGPSRMLLSKPVIAAIEGQAVAGGLELALWCDLRVVAEDATLGVFCRRWGVPLIDGGTQRLPQIIGLGRALDLILTGRPVDAKEAYQMGLANRVVASGQALATAIEMASGLTRFPQSCLAIDRLSTYQSFDHNLVNGLALEYTRGQMLVEAGAVTNGAQRFAQGKGRGTS